MDYLDRRKRRTHRRQLMLGYALVATAIILSSYLVVIAAGGIGYDTKTGSVIVNGLLFLDSQPSGADIYINGQNHGAKTATRLILPAGNYRVDLKRSGYHDWSRSFTLSEHGISRFVYPFLFPLRPAPVPLKTYSAIPSMMTNSPDHRWLLLQTSATGAPVFDEFDTSDLTLPPKSLSFPDGLLAGSTGAGSSFKVVEWASDNKNILVEHNYPGGKEFVVFNRASPADSRNINRELVVNPTQVAMRNKKVDQFYLFNQTNGNLDLGNIGSGQVVPLLTRVLAFKSSGADLIFYVTDQNAPAGQVMSRIWDNGKSYNLYSFAKGNLYLLDMAQFQGNWYYIAGSDQSSRFSIYKNPLDGLKNTAVGKALPLISLNQKTAGKMSFSANTRFVEVESGQSVAVFDFETLTRYHYSLQKPLSGSLHWMDGHRLIGSSTGSIFVTDYDSTNQQLLVPTASEDSIFFDSNYQHMLNLATASDGGITLYNTDLRAGADLPAAR